MALTRVNDFFQMVDRHRREYGMGFILKNALPFFWQRTVYLAFETWVGFDRRHGTETSRHVDVQLLRSSSPHARLAMPYGPLSPDRPFGLTLSAWWRTRKLFGSRPNWVPCDHAEYTFIDIGSGKGRTLLLASDYPFRRIIGVELFRELHEVAERNISIYRSPRQRCSRLESVCMDATEYEFPDDNLFLQFGDPFPAEVLDKVLKNLERSLAAHPRKLYISYWSPSPDHIALLSGKPYLTNLHTTDIWSLYQGDLTRSAPG